MDIKDFILLGGGILIVAVIAHGFWLAYRAKREPYRLDIVPDLIPDDVDDIERLRGELPNGGSRIKVAERQRNDGPTNLELDLEVPAAQPAAEERTASQTIEPTTGLSHPIRADAHGTDNRQAAEIRAANDVESEADLRQMAAIDSEKTSSAADDAETDLSAQDATPPRARVADIQLVTPDRSARQRSQLRSQLHERATRKVTRDQGLERTQQEPATEEKPAQELLVVVLLARKGTRFDGEAMVNALRKQGLKYGEMNIFHRVDQLTKAKNFSVANVLEPGTFDLSDLETLASPGMSFFMQLPGPEDACAALEDMLNTAQQIALDLGGDLRDEQMSVLTGQTKEHMRQRIADYTRRKLSMRA